jgi:hypothetical protein
MGGGSKSDSFDIFQLIFFFSDGSSLYQLCFSLEDCFSIQSKQISRRTDTTRTLAGSIFQDFSSSQVSGRLEFFWKAKNSSKLTQTRAGFFFFGDDF